MPQKLIEVRLKDCPPDVNRLIEKEQGRLDFHEDKKLKKEQVVYQMLRQWYQQKSIIDDLQKQVAELKKSIPV